MKKIDCEFYYYHSELMEYLATGTQTPKYSPESQFLELRKNIKAKNIYDVCSLEFSK